MGQWQTQEREERESGVAHSPGPHGQQQALFTDPGMEVSNLCRVTGMCYSANAATTESRQRRG